MGREYVHEVAWIYDFLVDLALPQRGSYRLSIWIHFGPHVPHIGVQKGHNGIFNGAHLG